ncbi:MAG: glycosyltransferase family 4 protein [Deltaproteobacteria bacterium]|nr:glycosyltransferase family 4 protein [Deltaproteobacteria bacterium]
MVAACPFPSGQGTQALIAELAAALSSRGHEIHLVCYGHGQGSSDGLPFRIHRAPGLPGYSRLRSGPDWVKPWLDALLALTCLRVVRRNGCQLIHAHNYEGLVAGCLAGRLAGAPVVYHAHNWMADELPQYADARALRALAARAGAWLDRSLPRRADRVIALHAGIARALRAAGVEEERIAVVLPGIDAAAWAPGRGAEREADTVVYAGNLDRYQRLPLVFEALARLRARRARLRFLLATPNPLAEAGRMLARHGIGDRTELVQAPSLQACRAVLHRARVAVSARTSPSGFPIKVLDYGAAGLPVVACRPCAHGVEHGQSGFVVEPEPEALARALDGLLARPALARRMGECAQRMVRERYSAGRMAREVEELWCSVSPRSA